MVKHIAYDFGVFEEIIGQLGLALDQKTMKTACNKRVAIIDIASVDIDCIQCLNNAIEHYAMLFGALADCEMPTPNLQQQKQEAMDATLATLQKFIDMTDPDAALERHKTAVKQLHSTIFGEPE